MDRASDSGSEGWGFESLPVYQKDQIPFGIWSFWYPERKGLEKINAARMSAAGDGLTEPNLYFCQRQKCKRVPSGVPFAKQKNIESCCGARRILRPTKWARIQPTAATRSARFICHRQRSHRSPFRCTAKRSLAKDADCHTRVRTGSQ